MQDSQVFGGCFALGLGNQRLQYTAALAGATSPSSANQLSGRGCVQTGTCPKVNQPIPAGKEVAFVVPIKGANEAIERVRLVSFTVGQQRSDGFYELKGGFLYLTGKEGTPSCSLVLSAL